VIATAPAPADAPIGWTELDDISQAGVTDPDEVREYSFEEADAATLAELGLSQTDELLAAPETEAQAAEAPKPRRGRKPVERAAASEPAEAPKPRRGRARPAAATKAGAEDTSVSATPRPRGRGTKPKADVTAEASAPKPRTRSRAARPAAQPDAEAAPADGAEEGIWQRFRGARTKTP